MTATIESGLWTIIWAPKKASTAFAVDSLVSLDDGYVTPADTSTGAADEPLMGIWAGKAITSATVGKYLYTNTELVPVLVPIGPAQMRCTVSTDAALTAASAGMSYDLKDAVQVNANATTYGTVTCTKYISATEGLFVISKSLYANVA